MKSTSTFATAALFAGLPATAQIPSATAPPAIIEKLWKAPVLYQDSTNPVLQEFSLAANIQWQWADGDSNQGNFGSRDRAAEVRWDDVEIRRMELGFRTKWFTNWKLQAKIDANPNGHLDPAADQSLGHGFYRDLHDLTLIYTASPAFTLGIGKDTPKLFTYENSTSSRELIIFERGLLVETLIPRDITGIWTTGEVLHWFYGFGVYAGDYQQELTRFDAGAVVHTSFGYDFAAPPHLDRAMVKLDHQYSSTGENSGGAGKFENAISLNTFFQSGRWALYTDLLAGLGRAGQGDFCGILVTPSVFVTDRLQLVCRFQQGWADDDGLQLASRYDRLAPDLTDTGQGSSFTAGYLGANYFIHGHKLKLMAGTEYSHMDGGSDGGSYDGFTTLAGLRLSF